MEAFRLYEHVIKSYRDSLSSFINIRDDRIRQYVEEKFELKVLKQLLTPWFSDKVLNTIQEEPSA